MTQRLNADQRRTLDADQKTDAGQMLGCGWKIRDTAGHFGLDEENFRVQMGLPVWKPEPKDTRHWSERGGAQ
jgi:hypothetical protein